MDGDDGWDKEGWLDRFSRAAAAYELDWVFTGWLVGRSAGGFFVCFVRRYPSVHPFPGLGNMRACEREHSI